ncbi:hypothetical protein GGU10DRAFT_197045 [Lentinula aff. detonsa]|uniref:Uncharacterized protein n=1 Tax=Lentinula aff. detonsa TaxID=2804958 RepID=A0AA38KS71_9AGAR|nr:hypothetical protein GGU10DRAFT_197045 [Lentinula aff. detonsa]
MAVLPRKLLMLRLRVLWECRGLVEVRTFMHSRMDRNSAQKVSYKKEPCLEGQSLPDKAKSIISMTDQLHQSFGKLKRLAGFEALNRFLPL